MIHSNLFRNLGTYDACVTIMRPVVTWRLCDNCCSEISCALVLSMGGNNRQTVLRAIAARKHVPIIGAEHSRWNVVCVLQTDD